MVGVKETTTGEAVLPWRGETLSHSGIVVGSTVKYADDPEPVSYTHLDVYKRQEKKHGSHGKGQGYLENRH